MDIVPTNPSYFHICAYIEYMVKDTPSPRTIANNLSNIRTYFRKVGIDTTQLDHHRVKWAMTAVDRDNEYVPRTKIAFPIQDLNRMVASLPDSVEGNIIKVSILIMYYAALRQSEVLSPSATTFDAKKHLTRGDVLVAQDSVTIRIKHAKNMQSVYQQKQLTLATSPNPSLCIVQALRIMLANTPTIHLNDPCIMFPHSRRPVSVDYVRRKWKQHLEAHGIQTSPLSLHSIRKAAATAAYQQGCEEIDIQRYGGWNSNSHRQYISTTQTTVNNAITRALHDI